MAPHWIKSRAGDKRRTDLLKHFGSIENIRQASGAGAELAILPRNAAQSVYEFFIRIHK